MSFYLCTDLILVVFFKTDQNLLLDRARLRAPTRADDIGIRPCGQRIPLGPKDRRAEWAGFRRIRRLTAASSDAQGARRGPSPASTGGTIVTPQLGSFFSEACVSG